MVNKNYCMSSYLAFRFIERNDMEYKKGFHHICDMPFPEEKRILVSSASEVAEQYKKIFKERQRKVKLGLLLSGGMDSASFVPFLKPGTDAYTFRFVNTNVGKEDLERAILYSKIYKLNLHFVDIDFEVMKRNMDLLMLNKKQPIHSIEPEILEACLQAKKDGVEQMVVASESDITFGGMTKMLSKDWTYKDWKKFYTFLDPKKVLKKPVSMEYAFRRYKLPNKKINYMKFIDEIFVHESDSSFYNASLTAKMKYSPMFDPSAYIKMKEKLDIDRIRGGDSKYIVRELFRKYYPGIEVPEKIPMPRAVDVYFKDWKGPTRKEFRNDIDMHSLTGNQKWQLFCLERFLNLIDF